MLLVYGPFVVWNNIFLVSKSNCYKTNLLYLPACKSIIAKHENKLSDFFKAWLRRRDSKTGIFLLSLTQDFKRLKLTCLFGTVDMLKYVNAPLNVEQLNWAIKNNVDIVRYVYQQIGEMTNMDITNLDNRIFKYLIHYGYKIDYKWRGQKYNNKEITKLLDYNIYYTYKESERFVHSLICKNKIKSS